MDKKKYYKIGNIVNPLPHVYEANPVLNSCSVKVASRVDTFLCHHHYFAEPPRTQVYPVCSINFAIDRFTQADVTLNKQGKIVIQDDSDRASIIIHTAKIMKKVLNTPYGFNISAKNLHYIKHGGFGSSASLQTAVAIAINTLFGNPICDHDMVKFLSQNYGEECDKKEHLSPMASIGGASAVALTKANTVIIGGESEIWNKLILSPEYKVIIGIPKISCLPDGITDMGLFLKGFEQFKKMGHEWGHIKEDLLKNKIIHGIQHGDTTNLFELINMYTIGSYGDIPTYFRNRWSSHSLFLDEFIHKIYFKLFSLMSRKENCFFISSGGPAIVFISKYPKLVKKTLREVGILTVFDCNLYHHGPEINVS